MPAAAKQFHISAAFPFIPRQIMLQNPPIIACQEEKKRRKEEKKAKKRSSETLDAAPAAPETLDLDVAANGGGRGLKGKERKLLLGSISAYLESNGFTRTLAIFQSEAELPTDGGKTSILNLEDLFCKFLESSKSSEDATADWSKEQDSVPGDDSHLKKKDKKKRKSAFDPVGENYAEGTHGMTSTVPENDLPDNDEKPKRKKKSKMSSDSFNGKHELGDKVKSQELVEEKVEELTSLSSTPAAESNPKVSGEKKKKTKRGSVASAGYVEEIDTGEFLEGNKKKSKDLKSLGSDSKTDSELLNSVTVDTSMRDASLNADSKSKGKKKKRDRTISETLHSVESYQVDGGMSNDVGGDTAGHTTTDVLENIDPTKEISEQNIDNLKVSKKRKKMALEERVLEPVNVVESMDSKHTRVDGAEEKKKRGIHQNLDMSLPDSEDLSVSKKQKTEKSYENSSEDVKTSFDQQISVSIEHKDNSAGYDSPKQANGNLEKESEGLSSKILKKEKRSAEPTSNAFRRVKLEEVEFVDERLQNNSYWAKGGADSGYGAKAQEILGQVKGRNFRHEKTKKKRGSYRGGQIDLQSHSIKFNYSDEE